MMTLNEFFHAGGMSAIEREAAQRAIKDERRLWLPMLEAWRVRLPADDLMMIVWLEAQIRRARKGGLGLKRFPSPQVAERRRIQTRERVRRFRERQRLKA
jgi:hypothetical protein